MSGYIPPYPPEILFNPALPLPGDQSWRPPAPSAQVALQQPFDWPVPPALPSSGFPAQEPFRSYEVNGNGFYEGAPGGLPIQPQPLLQPSETGWGFPRGGALHVAAGLPDEMLPKHFGAGSELVKVTGKVRRSLELCWIAKILIFCSLLLSLAQAVGHGKSRQVIRSLRQGRGGQRS